MHYLSYYYMIGALVADTFVYLSHPHVCTHRAGPHLAPLALNLTAYTGYNNMLTLMYTNMHNGAQNDVICNHGHTVPGQHLCFYVPPACCQVSIPRPITGI